MKKLNKWIAGLLCMMLVITMVAGLGVTEVKADDAVTQHVSSLRHSGRTAQDLQRKA